MLSKGQVQGQFKCHQMRTLNECRATHVLLVIWDAEFDGDIHF